MSDLVRDPALVQTIHSQHPALVKAKLQSTHSPALQREAVQRVHWLMAQLLHKRLRCFHALREAVSSSMEEDDDEQEHLEWYGGKNREFIMLTVELVGLLYAFVLYLGLVWCKMGRFVSF